MSLPRWKQRQIESVRKDARTKDPSAGPCRWCDPMSRKPSMKADGKGVSRSMCRPHMEHRHRHGHPLKPSYEAKSVRPLELLARRWLRTALKTSDHATAAAIASARNFILCGKDHGQTLPTKPKAKAEAVLGRLYAKYCGERTPAIRTRWPTRRTLDGLALEVVAMALAIELAQTIDPAPCSDPHFADVQVGKLIFRRAGGWLRRSEREDQSQLEYRTAADGTLKRGPVVYAIELNRYGISRGPVLVHLGKPLRATVESIWTAHNEELEAKARALGIPSIESWTLARRNPTPPKRGGKRPRKAQAPNPFQRPHDKRRKLTTAI